MRLRLGKTTKRSNNSSNYKAEAQLAPKIAPNWSWRWLRPTVQLLAVAVLAAVVTAKEGLLHLHHLLNSAVLHLLLETRRLRLFQAPHLPPSRRLCLALRAASRAAPVAETAAAAAATEVGTRRLPLQQGGNRWITCWPKRLRPKLR